MTYFEKNELKQFFPMFSMLNAIGGIGKVADFTTPCVNITNSAFTQLLYIPSNLFSIKVSIFTKVSKDECSNVSQFMVLSSNTFRNKVGTETVADGWAGPVMQKPLAIQKYF